MAQFCSSCGAQIADGSTACPSCGKAAGVGGGAAAAPAPAQASGGLEENVAGMLAYISPIPAIIFLVIEPYNRNRFVRFHAFQGIFYHVASIVVAIVVMMIPFLNFVLWPLANLALFIGWIICLIKAFQGQMFKLPVIGPIAEKQAAGQ